MDYCTAHALEQHGCVSHLECNLSILCLVARKQQTAAWQRCTAMLLMNKFASRQFGSEVHSSSTSNRIFALAVQKTAFKTWYSNLPSIHQLYTNRFAIPCYNLATYVELPSV